MTTDISALQSAVRVMMALALDTEDAMNAGGNTLKILAAYDNLLPDLLSIIPKIGDIPAEIKLLKPSDYVVLTTDVVAALGITDAHAEAVANAALALFDEIATGLVPKIEFLCKIIHAQGGSNGTGPG